MPPAGLLTVRLPVMVAAPDGAIVPFAPMIRFENVPWKDLFAPDINTLPKPAIVVPAFTLPVAVSTRVSVMVSVAPFSTRRSLIVVFDESVGWFGRPAQMNALSVAAGAPVGLQLAATVQSVLRLPIQLFVNPAGVGVAHGFAGGAALMITVIDAEPVKLPASVTLAVIVCVPCNSVVVLTLAPLPRLPLMLELHARDADRFPCCASLAVPVNVTLSPTVNGELFGGAVICTTGGVFTTTGFTISVMDACAIAPCVSFTDAVMVWVPVASVVVDTL